MLDSADELQRLRKFLRHLLKKNNPQYEDVFQVELLDTEARKLEEFNRRKLSKEYNEAQYRCQICYKVFDVQRLLDYHNRWHEVTTTIYIVPMCVYIGNTTQLPKWRQWPENNVMFSSFNRQKKYVTATSY